MMNYQLLLCSCLAAVSVTSQDVTFTAKERPLIGFRATQVPQIVAQWPETCLGRFFQDPDARYAGELGVNHMANEIRRQTETYQTVQQLDYFDSVQPYLLSSIYRLQDIAVWRLAERPVDEVQSVELRLHADPKEGMGSDPRHVRIMSCRPRHAGRWTQLFEHEARQRTDSNFFTPASDAKVGGFPAYVFGVPAEILQANSRLSEKQWMLQLPGQFIYGSGRPEHYGEVGAAPNPTEAEVSFEIDIEQFSNLQEGLRAEPEIKLLGLDTVERFRWSAYFVDELLYDVMTVYLSSEPSGALATLLQGDAELPAQPLPDGALAQLRAAIAPQAVIDLVGELLPGDSIDAWRSSTEQSPFDGGFAIACCAPLPGGLIPRIYLTANLTDAEALTELTEQLFGTTSSSGEDVPLKQLKFGDVEVTVLKIPGAPQGLQPAWCQIGDKLHVAESARSLRSFLKAQASDKVAMDVDGMAPPVGRGELLPNFDLRFDIAAIYENFYRTWLPLFELSNTGSSPLPISRDDLPDPEVVAEHLKKGRGVFRRDGNNYSLIQASGAGGLEMAAVLFTWGTMIAPSITASYTTEQWSNMIARNKLKAVHQAIARFEKREQRRPANLAELMDAEQLADDALLLPADNLAEPHKLKSGQIIKSSFRYFSTGTAWAGGGHKQPALLIEVRPSRYNRAVLFTDGTIPEVYSGDLQKPIDQFRALDAPEPSGDGRKHP